MACKAFEYCYHGNKYGCEDCRCNTTSKKENKLIDDKQRIIEVMKAHEGKFTSKYPSYCGSQQCCGVSLACNACDARLNDNADALIAAGFGDVKARDKRIAELEFKNLQYRNIFDCEDEDSLIIRKFSDLWKLYADEKDENLTQKALELKSKIINAVKRKK